MKCARCQAEIADKAIVCYRCGTPTAIPAAPERPAAAQGGRRGAAGVIVAVVVGLVLLAVWYVFFRQTV